MGILSDIFKGGTEGIFSGISGIIKNFKADPLELAKLEVAVTEAKANLEARIVEAESRAQEAVNATMRAEAASEHFLQYSWRPLVGYSFVATVANNFILMPYFQKWLTPLSIPAEVWYAWLAILGVTAGFRGLEKWQISKNGK
mgnify:FL=1